MVSIRKSDGLPLVAALVLFFGGSAGVQAEYRTPSGYFSILNSPNYGRHNGRSYLLWNNFTAQLPSSRAYFVAVPLTPGVQVGATDQCVAFARAVTLARPAGANGENWRRGRRVVGGSVAPGTLIATFTADGSRYQGHATVFRGHSGNGLLCWSQNWPAGFGCVVAHSIPATGGGGVTDALAYYVVE